MQRSAATSSFRRAGAPVDRLARHRGDQAVRGALSAGVYPLDAVFFDQDGGPLTTNAVLCVLRRIRLKLGLTRLSAHQFRRTWATNFRRLGVGDLYDLPREGGWEDLEVPQRFYLDVEETDGRGASVMDRNGVHSHLAAPRSPSSTVG
ncbi:MAG: tyrosine-type recombinase/integrase [Chloroflexi bacterium]|nr:tyrosine-type recombinase/integrase [Chloroflexota bacterium]